MSDKKSQEGSAFSNIGELLLEAKKRTAENPKPEPEKPKVKGLIFMAMQLTVAKTHFELAIQKKITPAEDNLLKLIEIGTIGAQNGRSQITSMAEFFLDDLARDLCILKNKVYVHLRSLEKKKYIIRRKGRSKGREMIGLNPEIFGQVLVDKQHEIDRKRHLKLAVDNTRKSVDNSGSCEETLVPNEDQNNPDSGPEESHSGTELVPNQDQIGFQLPDNIDKNQLLDSFRSYLDTLRWQNPKDTKVSTEGTGTKKPRSNEEHRRIIRDQLKLASEGKL